MARVPLAPYEPDKADLDAGIATVARNVIPGSNCYLPARALTPFSGTAALAGSPLGMFLAQKSDGTFIMFAAANDGSNDRIYTYASGTWTDRSYTGGYATAEASGWRFAQYGNYVYAVSGANNAVQVIDLTDLASGFSAVAGNGGTAPPRAKYITVINEFLVLAGLTDYPTSVMWSGIGDANEWRVTTLGSDMQEFPDGGLVTGITGAEYGLVFQENSIRRMVFAPGSAYVFEFSRIVENSGTSAVASIARTNSRVFWLAEDGFWMESGGSLMPIGAERVNRTFFGDIAVSGVPYVQGYADPVTQRVYWAYPSSSQSDVTVRDKLLCYHYVLDRWSTIEQNVTYIGPVAPDDISIDDAPLATMSLEEVPYSFDSPYWQGGRPAVGGFGDDLKLGTFTGDTLEATVESALLSFNAPNRSMVKRVAPLIDTSAARVNVATRAKTFDADTWRTERTPSSGTGYCHFTASGRHHRLRMRIPAGTTWTKAVGFEAEAGAEGWY